jgi:hypothetical protein
MEMHEKIERLREKADVTPEEAGAALEETGGDLLDAMVLLERRGKVRGRACSSFSTEYDQQTEYVRVKDKVEEQENSAPSFSKSLQRFFRALIRFVRSTTFQVTRGEESIISMPTLVFALLLLFFLEILAPAMIIALFFGIRYSFEGEEGADTANSILHKAGDFAQDVKQEFVQKEEKTSDGE